MNRLGGLRDLPLKGIMFLASGVTRKAVASCHQDEFLVQHMR